MRCRFAISATLLAVLSFVATRSTATDPPRPGLILPCEVVEWHDGDTGTVRITLDVRVRLLDCWAPETKGRSLTAAEKKLTKIEQQAILTKITAEKQRGIDSLKSVSQIAPIGSRGYLEIPLDGVERSDDLFTMGRLLGRVWINGKDVSALQVDSGHATTVKKLLEPSEGR